MDISTLLGQAAGKWPEAPALHEPATGRRLTFAQLDQALTAFGLGLTSWVARQARAWRCWPTPVSTT